MMGGLMAQCEGPMMEGRPSITNRLKQEKENLEKRLDKINEALRLMEENPTVSKVLDVLGQTYL